MSPLDGTLAVSTLDVVFLVILAAGALRAAIRGFVAEAFTVGAVVVGLAGAALLTELVSTWLDGVVGVSGWNPVIAFLLLFVALYLVVKIVEAVLHRFFAALHLQKLDHVLGLLLGLVEAAVVIVVVVVLLALQPLVDATPILQRSVLAQLTLSILILGTPPPLSSLEIPL